MPPVKFRALTGADSADGVDNTYEVYGLKVGSTSLTKALRCWTVEHDLCAVEILVW